MEQSTASSNNYSQEEKYMGCVKWFNSQKGFGYITLKSGPLTGEDIFTHHSAIVLQDEKYKYLVAGEYVHITVMDCNKEGFKYQANLVCAPCENGQLMCEIRSQRKPRDSRSKYSNEESH